MVEAALLAERTADLQRVQAEYANYRKRVERDRLAGRRRWPSGGCWPTCCRCSTTSTGPAPTATSTGAFKAVADRLDGVLAKLGLEAFGEVGDPFDPALHEAVHARREPPTSTEPTCTTVMRRGYRLGERLLRPAMVGVTDPAEPAAPSAAPGAGGRTGRRATRGAPGPPGPGGDRTIANQEEVTPDEHEGLAREGLLRGARRRQGRRRGRHQEGVPQAGPRAAPGQEPGRRQGRGAVQGGLRGLRRAVGRGQAQGVRRGPLAVRRRRRRLRRLRRRAAPALAAAARGASTSPTCSAPRSGRRRPRRPVRRPVRRARGDARRRHRRPGPARGRTSRRGHARLRPRRCAATTLPLQLSGPAPARPATAAAPPGTAPRTCPTCAGSGFVSRNQGAFGFTEPCRDCRGTGQLVDDPCPECRGTGTTTQTRTITVRVPAGVRDGAKLRIAGKGTPGRAAARPATCSSPCTSAPHALFGAHRRRPDAHGAGHVHRGGAGHDAAGADPRRRRVAEGPAGHAVRAHAAGARPRRRDARAATGDLLVTVEVAVPTELSARRARRSRRTPRRSTTTRARTITAALGAHRAASAGRRPVARPASRASCPRTRRSSSSRWPPSWPACTRRPCASTTGSGW